MLFWGLTKIDLIKLGFIVLVILLRRKSAWGPGTTDGTSYVGRRDGSEGLSFRAEAGLPYIWLECYCLAAFRMMDI